MQPVHQMAFMVRLAKIDVKTKFSCLIIEPSSDIIEGIGPVNLRFSHPEQVKVGAVEDEDDGVGGQGFLADAVA
jgi:hypothetical protein